MVQITVINRHNLIQPQASFGKREKSRTEHALLRKQQKACDSLRQKLGAGFSTRKEAPDQVILEVLAQKKLTPEMLLKKPSNQTHAKKPKLNQPLTRLQIIASKFGDYYGRVTEYAVKISRYLGLAQAPFDASKELIEIRQLVTQRMFQLRPNAVQKNRRIKTARSSSTNIVEPVAQKTERLPGIVKQTCDALAIPKNNRQGLLPDIVTQINNELSLTNNASVEEKRDYLLKRHKEIVAERKQARQLEKAQFIASSRVDNNDKRFQSICNAFGIPNEERVSLDPKVIFSIYRQVNARCHRERIGDKQQRRQVLMTIYQQRFDELAQNRSENASSSVQKASVKCRKPRTRTATRKVIEPITEPEISSVARYNMLVASFNNLIKARSPMPKKATKFMDENPYANFTIQEALKELDGLVADRKLLKLSYQVTSSRPGYARPQKALVKKYGSGAGGYQKQEKRPHKKVPPSLRDKDIVIYFDPIRNIVIQPDLSQGQHEVVAGGKAKLNGPHLDIFSFSKRFELDDLQQILGAPIRTGEEIWTKAVANHGAFQQLLGVHKAHIARVPLASKPESLARVAV